MIIQNQNFDLEQIADSGQCFRMFRLKENQHKYGLVAYGKYLEMEQLTKNKVKLHCLEQEYIDIWEDYFDLKYDYDKVVSRLQKGEDSFLKEAANYGSGIRILQQEPFEALISFIISQNKNIPAIKSCIEALCERYGEEIVTVNNKTFYSFPTAITLSQASKEELRLLKTGYRDDYIISAASAVCNGALLFEQLKKGSFDESVLALKKIHGIGDKVANCVALYGLHHIDGFPVDVWIKKVLSQVYQNNFDLEPYQGYAGIVQQYMFYYMRYLQSVK